MQLRQKNFAVQVIIFYYKLTFMDKKKHFSPGIYFRRRTRQVCFMGIYSFGVCKTFFAELVFTNFQSVNLSKFLQLKQTYCNVKNDSIRTLLRLSTFFLIICSIFRLKVGIYITIQFIQIKECQQEGHFGPRRTFIYAKGGP